eukprot:4372174-Amphidinium_carterae.1
MPPFTCTERQRAPLTSTRLKLPYLSQGSALLPSKKAAPAGSPRKVLSSTPPLHPRPPHQLVAHLAWRTFFSGLAWSFSRGGRPEPVERREESDKFAFRRGGTFLDNIIKSISSRTFKCSRPSSARASQATASKIRVSTRPHAPTILLMVCRSFMAHKRSHTRANLDSVNDRQEQDASPRKAKNYDLTQGGGASSSETSVLFEWCHGVHAWLGTGLAFNDN